MKLAYALLATLILAACNTSPQILPDTTGESVLMKRLNHQISTGDGSAANWGWVLWYFPIVILVFAWAWKEWVRPSINALENEDIDKQKQNGLPAAETDQPQQTDQS
jgi:hypothetical protein